MSPLAHYRAKFELKEGDVEWYAFNKHLTTNNTSDRKQSTLYNPNMEGVRHLRLKQLEE